jgi:pimeloyl-ACP methyl ester carboxylesterase
MDSMADVGAPLFIEVENVRIRYVSSSIGGQRTPIVLLSPFPESLYAFDEIWADLAQAAPLVALDLPGFGHSEGRPELMTPQAMGTFVTKALPAVGLRRVHAIGPDVGTSALLFAASQKPDLFESLVVGSGGTDVAHTGAGLKDIILAPSTDSFAAIDGADFAAAVIDQRVQNKPATYVLNDYRASYSGSRAVEAMAYLRAYPTYLPLLQEALPGIHTPVLSIGARVIPSCCPRVRKYLIERCRIRARLCSIAATSPGTTAPRSMRRPSSTGSTAATRPPNPPQQRGRRREVPPTFETLVIRLSCHAHARTTRAKPWPRSGTRARLE